VHVELPRGITVGHHTDRDAWTGCTAILLPEGTVAAAEVRGGGPGTRESELLAPAANAQGVHAVLLTGGSAFGLGAADGVMGWLEGRGIGYATPGGLVPLVFAAVVYDLILGDGGVRPRPADAGAACEAAGPTFARGSVGAGTGCTVGKLRRHEGWTKGGLGAASLRAGDALVTAIAAVNPVGDVLDADGSVLAGVWDGERYVRTTDLLLAGERPQPFVREATTLVCILTDARVDKRGAWLVARAGSAGVARAVSPSATAADGDLVVCAATGEAEADPFALAALAPEAVAEAIRDAVRSATGAPGCPAAAERAPRRP
jgi:L-aminopeptidase/D-esterase-like protein